jgi:hypothetical protein
MSGVADGLARSRVSRSRRKRSLAVCSSGFSPAPCSAGDQLAEAVPGQRQFLAVDVLQVLVQRQRHAGQQVKAVHAVVRLVGRCPQGDAHGQRLAAVLVAEHQRDVGGGGAALAAFVTAAEHAQAVVADGARAVAAAGLCVEADAAAVAAEQHDLQRVQQRALAGAVGSDDRAGRIQLQALRLEQEELDEVDTFKQLHRLPLPSRRCRHRGCAGPAVAATARRRPRRWPGARAGGMAAGHRPRSRPGGTRPSA